MPNVETDGDRWLVMDETTIYEVDPECCRNMTERERAAAGIEGCMARREWETEKKR